MTKKGKGSGWHGESRRHSLASRGVKSNSGHRYGEMLDKSKVGKKLGKFLAKGRLLGEDEFVIDDDVTILCRAEKTRNGFRHVAEFYRQGQLVGSAKESYLNRTWEKYDFETVILKLLGKVGVTGVEKDATMARVEKQALGRVDDMYRSVAMVASMGEIFGQTEKEKNDWKLRMIKAGMGTGFIEPSDWDSLSEIEKGRRLDKVIEYMKREDKFEAKGIISLLRTNPAGHVMPRSAESGLRLAQSNYPSPQGKRFPVSSGKAGGLREHIRDLRDRARDEYKNTKDPDAYRRWRYYQGKYEEAQRW